MDARLERSREAILRAIVPLVEQGPLAGISITRLVSAAGITRPTFYQHFPDVPAAARAAGLARLDAAFPFPEPIPDGVPATAARIRARVLKQALPLFAHLAEHRVFYGRVMEEAGTAGLFDSLVAFTATRLLPGSMALLAGAPERVATTTRFFAGGLTWLAINWLRSGATVPPAEFSRQVARMVTDFAARALETRKPERRRR